MGSGTHSREKWGQAPSERLTVMGSGTIRARPVTAENQYANENIHYFNIIYYD